MQPHDDLVVLPARTFVLGEGLDVGVSACTATVWRPPADPERLHLLLAWDVDNTTTIAIDLDLLADGMSACVDRGPVTVWPCRDDDVVCIGLRGSLRAVVELPGLAVADFLAANTAPGQIFGQASQ